MQRIASVALFVAGIAVTLVVLGIHHIVTQPSLAYQLPPSQFEEDVTYALNHQVGEPRTATLSSQWTYAVMNWESRDQFVWTDPDRNRQLWIDIPAGAQLTEMNTIPDGRILSCYAGDHPPAPRCTNGLAILVHSDIYEQGK